MRTGTLQFCHHCINYMSCEIWIVSNQMPYPLSLLFLFLFSVGLYPCLPPLSVYLSLSSFLFPLLPIYPLFYLYLASSFPLLSLHLFLSPSSLVIPSINACCGLAGSPSWSSLMTSTKHTCRRRSTSTGRKESQTPEFTAAYTLSPRRDTGKDMYSDTHRAKKAWM